MYDILKIDTKGRGNYQIPENLKTKKIVRAKITFMRLQI